MINICIQYFISISIYISIYLHYIHYNDYNDYNDYNYTYFIHFTCSKSLYSYDVCYSTYQYATYPEYYKHLHNDHYHYNHSINHIY